jgi:hypothetical protein
MLDRYGEALTAVNDAVDVIGNRADSNASVLFVKSMIAKSVLYEMTGDARQALRAADSGLARLRQLPWGTSLRDPQEEAELLKLRDQAARAVKSKRRR